MIQYTHRTPQGQKARILCTDYVHTSSKIDAPFCVVVAILDYEAPGDESIAMLTADLKLHVGSKAPYLTEYSPWNDVAIDTPVWCRDLRDDPHWEKRHFAGFHHDGRPLVWNDGKTSHTAIGRAFVQTWGEITITNPNTNSEQA